MELKDKAIEIKGKKYVLVSDRVMFFNESFPNGSIRTEMLSSIENEMVLFKATVLPDVSKPDRYFTGYSQATWDDGYINKTAAIENCETSAVGRALGFMGIGVIDSIASIDEINKAQTQPPPKFQNWKADFLKMTTDMANSISAIDLKSILLGYGIDKLDNVKNHEDAAGIYKDIKARYKELK